MVPLRGSARRLRCQAARAEGDRLRRYSVPSMMTMRRQVPWRAGGVGAGWARRTSGATGDMGVYLVRGGAVTPRRGATYTRRGAPTVAARAPMTIPNFT